MLDFIKNISPQELVILALVVFVLFGSKAVIGLGKAGGETVKEIKKIKKTFMEAIEDDEPQQNKKGVSK